MSVLQDNTDTIAAIATPPGQGGIGVVRISGPLARDIGLALCGKSLLPRQAQYCRFLDPDSQLIDAGIALYFPGPASFTGEDVLELQGHGGQTVMNLLLQHCCRAGARLAAPGEFSLRAYLNDKLDLAQAEAIADLINATTEAGVRSANRSLQGSFSREIDALMTSLLELRVYVEASIDFPEEEIDFIQQGQVAERLHAVLAQLDRVLDSARQGRILRDGMKLVIAGRPNAGKSSLLNALSGEETAIVTPIEGTTRDVLREHIQIDGMPLHIVDTAGLRDSDDIVEREGIDRAWREIETADHVLLVVDDSNPQDRAASLETLWPELTRHLGDPVPVTIIHNKCDLTGSAPSVETEVGSAVVTLSARTGAGLDLLRSQLKEAMGYSAEQTDTFMARQRHLDALHAARAFLEQGCLQLNEYGAGELLAEDLRRSHDQLGEITGAMTPDELLGEIFSSFCIGK